MKHLFLLLALAFTVGCDSILAPPDFRYAGKIPLELEVNETDAREFAARLATMAQLTVIDEGVRTEDPDSGRATTVRLVRKSSDVGFVEVKVYPWRHKLLVRIGGGIEYKDVNRIAYEAIGLFARTYPPSTMRFEKQDADFRRRRFIQSPLH